MDAVRIFRGLILTSFALILAAFPMAWYDTLETPPEIDAYLEGAGQGLLFSWFDSAPFPVPLIIGVALGTLVVAWVAALIGLFWVKNWARTLYLGTFLTGVLVSPLLGSTFSTPISSMHGWLLSACDGAIAVMLFLSPIRERFSAAPNNKLQRARGGSFGEQ